MRASEYILSKIGSYGNKTAQVDTDTGRILTFDEVSEKSRTLTRWLRAHNLGCGKTIGLMSKNSVDFVWILLGIWDSGAACHLIDSRYTLREVTDALKTAPVDMLVLQKGVLNSTSLKSSKINCIVEFGDGESDSDENVILMDHILRSTIAEKATKTDENGNTEKSQEINCTETTDLALILSSSGTTGLPKGVMYTHDSIFPALKNGDCLIDKDGRTLGLMPFSHIFGLHIMLLCLCEGGTLVNMSKFSLSTWVKVIKEFSVTRLHVVPSLLATLINSDVIDFHDLSSVRHVFAGGAPINAENLEKLKSRFLQPIDVHVVYGLSEYFHTVFGSVCDPRKPGMLGKICGPTKVKIIDVKTGKMLGANLAGEICIKGPPLMKGYINNPEATALATDEEGWLKTGDLGYFDEDNCFYFVDRIKHIIKYQGHQISPSELEFVLISHPHIEEAAVVGVEHDIFGQVPRAFVTLQEGSNISAQEIHDYIRELVAPFKLLRGGVVFISSMPKTSAGKIQRRLLNTFVAEPIFYDQHLKNFSPESENKSIESNQRRAEII